MVAKKNSCHICYTSLRGTNWCRPCQARGFRENFCNWSSGNKAVDAYIQETQTNATECTDYLLYIPFDSIMDRCREEGEVAFGPVYAAYWRDGFPDTWDSLEHRFVPSRTYSRVQLISFGRNVRDMLSELRLQHAARLANPLMSRLFGVTRDPNNEWMIVTDGAEWDVRRYASHQWTRLTWRARLQMLRIIAAKLRHHLNRREDDLEFGFGNPPKAISTHVEFTAKELGLGDRTDEVPVISYAKYDILPYMAPEILEGHSSPNASVYSFGMLMYEFAHNKPPFDNVEHDERFLRFVVDKTNPVRPRVSSGLPRPYVSLMRQCWEAETCNRPSFDKILENLDDWVRDDGNYAADFHSAERRLRRLLQEQGFESELGGEMRLPPHEHCQAIYVTRKISFIVPDKSTVRRRCKYSEFDEYDQSEVEKGFYAWDDRVRARTVFPELQYGQKLISV